MKFKPFPKGMTWLNTEKPLTLDEIKGHVVLFDFWTYGSIDCINALSDIAWLEEKYKYEPFIVIGIHSAKFSNEMDVDNINSAIERYEINYPILVDNNHRLWTIYGITT